MKKVVLIVLATAFVLAVGVFSFATYEVTNFAAGRAEFQRGYKAMMSHSYESAVRDFTASLKKPDWQSGRAWALAYRGESYRGLDRFSDAIDDFSAALKLYPHFTYALEARGFAYEEMRQPELALADYKQALREDPNLGLVWYYEGLIYERARAFEPARDAFRQAIRSSPKYVDAYIEAGYAASHLKDRGGAITSFDAAIRIDPKSAAAFAARGRFYRSEHEDDRAIAD
ncbi:MAG TPA: tetratricopeptide repeat protein, partial [Chthoniobacterales bacterium]